MPEARERSSRAGFSLLELIMVMIVGAILGTIAIPQISSYLNQRTAVNARDTFGMMAARARAAAIERGDLVWLTVDPGENHVRVDTVAGAPPLDMMDLSEGDMVATILASGVITVFYTPRGFADPGSSSALPASVGFAAGPDTARSTITPIGRVERQ